MPKNVKYNKKSPCKVAGGIENLIKLALSAPKITGIALGDRPFDLFVFNKHPEDGSSEMSFLFMLGHIFNVSVTSAFAVFGVDFACMEQCGLCKCRTEDLIDEDCKQSY